MNAVPTQPPADLSERALAQRERVLGAAEQCFLRRGFHVASIADIAAAAEMSAGLIYRYFENKNAIVMAIIERQLDDGVALIERLKALDDVQALFLMAYDHWHQCPERCTGDATPQQRSTGDTTSQQRGTGDATPQERGTSNATPAATDDGPPPRSRAALFLEIAAEATRHADIAATLHTADAAIRQRLHEALKRHARTHGDATDAAELQHRTLLLQLLLEGLAVRVIRDPSLTRRQLRSALEGLLPRLLSPVPL